MTIKSQKAKIHEGRPPKCHIRTGDSVVLLTGPKDRRGQTGTVIRVFPRRQRALVEGPCSAVDTRHVKANPQANVEGGRVTRLRTIHISNLALLDPETGKPTRVRRERNDDGKVVRVSKKSGHRFEVQ
ncbi:MAG: 50S ribosomal protein L24 [Planctomycetota bacterium]|nr:MAG: 50S ribosomal protein L24 [Planctomycetota bacterium]